jgi:hypothetical protein
MLKAVTLIGLLSILSAIPAHATELSDNVYKRVYRTAEEIYNYANIAWVASAQESNSKDQLAGLRAKFCYATGRIENAASQLFDDATTTEKRGLLQQDQGVLDTNNCSSGSRESYVGGEKNPLGIGPQMNTQLSLSYSHILEAARKVKFEVEFANPKIARQYQWEEDRKRDKQ